MMFPLKTKFVGTDPETEAVSAVLFWLLYKSAYVLAALPSRMETANHPEEDTPLT